jgi:hypothetical protein
MLDFSCAGETHDALFPDGAALLFDYAATGEAAEAQPTPALVSFGSWGAHLPPIDYPQEERPQEGTYSHLTWVWYAGGGHGDISVCPEGSCGQQ